MYKVGQVLYDCFYDDEEGQEKVTAETWIVRTIRGGRVHAVMKTSFTWGKRSTKNGDFGWLDPVPAWLRKSTSVGHDFYGLYTTRSKAVNAVLAGYTTGRQKGTPEAAKAIQKLRAYRNRIRK